jgi:hypothetical protein
VFLARSNKYEFLVCLPEVRGKQSAEPLLGCLPNDLEIVVITYIKYRKHACRHAMSFHPARPEKPIAVPLKHLIQYWYRAYSFLRWKGNTFISKGGGRSYHALPCHVINSARVYSPYLPKRFFIHPSSIGQVVSKHRSKV